MRQRSLRSIGLATVAILAAGAAYFGVHVSLVHPVAAAVETPAVDWPQQPGTRRDSYADTVDRVAPAVVTIHSAHRARPAQQFPFPDDPFFRQFFGDPNRARPRDVPAPMEQALGSGVIVTPDGYILTNQHVIDGADQIFVELNDRRSLKAKVVGSDAPSDLALLKVDAKELPVLSLGDSDKVRVGDVCLAVGNPLGIGETVTSGIISARGRATGLSDGSFEDFLQTDAAINQGNSGGALVNTRGELIGINSQIISTSGGNIGIGFAIPSNMAKNVMQQLKDTGSVRRGKLGMGIQGITPDLAKSLGVSDLRGVLVNSVEGHGPAEAAGVKTGDVITAINGVRVDDPNAFRNRIAAFAPGTEVSLTLLYEGHEKQVAVRLSELSADKAAVQASGTSEPRVGRLGVVVAPLTATAAAQRGVLASAGGVVITQVDPSGAAAAVGLQVDDVIVEVNHQPVRSAPELQAALHKVGAGPLLLLVNRDGRSLFVAIESRG